MALIVSAPRRDGIVVLVELPDDAEVGVAFAGEDRVVDVTAVLADLAAEGHSLFLDGSAPLVAAAATEEVGHLVVPDTQVRARVLDPSGESDLGADELWAAVRGGVGALLAAGVAEEAARHRPDPSETPPVP